MGIPETSPTPRESKNTPRLRAHNINTALIAGASSPALSAAPATCGGGVTAIGGGKPLAKRAAAAAWRPAGNHKAAGKGIFPVAFTRKGGATGCLMAGTLRLLRWVCAAGKRGASAGLAVHRAHIAGQGACPRRPCPIGAALRPTIGHVRKEMRPVCVPTTKPFFHERRPCGGPCGR
jgi:hypothetical protein